MTWNRASLIMGACAVALLVAASGCSPMPELGETTAEETYDIGVAAAERGDYILAIEAFKRVTLNTPLHDTADNALIGLGDAYRAISDFASAENEYRRLASDYPYSQLVPEAEYKLGLSFFDQTLPAALDQSMTRQAISQFEFFLATYPDSHLADEASTRILELRTRLAEKNYSAAALYLSMEQPMAARVYLEAVAQEFPDTVWARVAILEKARSFALEGSRALAENEYQRIIEQYPGTEEAALAAAELAAL